MTENGNYYIVIQRWYATGCGSRIQNLEDYNLSDVVEEALIEELNFPVVENILFDSLEKSKIIQYNMYLNKTRMFPFLIPENKYELFVYPVFRITLKPLNDVTECMIVFVNNELCKLRAA